MAGLVYTAEELAELLGIKKHTIYKHIDEIPHIRVGKSLRFPKDLIAEWLRKGALSRYVGDVEFEEELREVPMGDLGEIYDLDRQSIYENLLSSGVGVRENDLTIGC